MRKLFVALILLLSMVIAFGALADQPVEPADSGGEVQLLVLPTESDLFSVGTAAHRMPLIATPERVLIDVQAARLFDTTRLQRSAQASMSKTSRTNSRSSPIARCRDV
jgi:hypothetical protein